MTDYKVADMSQATWGRREIDIAETDSVPLLQMPEAAGGGDVLKALAPIITKHDIWHECFERRIASTEVDIEEAVAIDVAEVGAHRKVGMVEAG